ncbi:MAG: hypothetical protein AB8F95_17720 [Bacteroidia bacterium]
MEKETFLPHLNTVFNLPFSDREPLPLELIEVKELVKHPETPREPFSLVFRNEMKEQHLIQNFYQLQHKALGDVSLFLVPIGPDDQGMRYEALFN